MVGTIVSFLVLFPLFAMAVVVHEVSHGVVALRFGDTTALHAGRLTLNPFKHIDPMGTLVLPLLLLLLRAPFIFGWAKPVPVNPFNMRHPRRDMLWVGAAGPASNLLLAAAASLLLTLPGPFAHPVFGSLVRYLIVVNLVLGVFNLMPVPPLDGSRILTGLLPPGGARFMLSLERWGILLVMLLLYLGIIDRILWPAVSWIARLLGV